MGVLGGRLGGMVASPCAPPADIDECGTEMAHCRANQFCVNTEGSYECRGGVPPPSPCPQLLWV